VLATSRHQRQYVYAQISEIPVQPRGPRRGAFFVRYTEISGGLCPGRMSPLPCRRSYAANYNFIFENNHSCP